MRRSAVLLAVLGATLLPGHVRSEAIDDVCQITYHPPGTPSDQQESGLSRVVCDVYPVGVTAPSGQLKGGGFYNADEKKRAMEDGAVVYVSAADIPRFQQEVFQHVPKDGRSIVIMTHWADNGAPWELFVGPLKRDNFAALVMSKLKDFASFWRVNESEVDTIQKRVDRLREFVNDPRLKHWYIQNYDMVGCGPYADPAFSPNETASQKVSPLPMLFARMYCPDDYFLPDGVTKSRPSSEPLVTWQERQRKLLFGYPRMGHKMSRRASLEAAKNMGGDAFEYHIPKDWSKSHELRKWQSELRSFRYVLCGTGNGVDTYRFWEALRYGTVPVVITSALDSVYELFPVVIVREWGGADFTLDNFDAYLASAGWDPLEPFQDPELLKRMTLTFWRDLIRSGQPVPAPGGLQRTYTRAYGAYPGCSAPTQIRECEGTAVDRWNKTFTYEDHQECARKGYGLMEHVGHYHPPELPSDFSNLVPLSTKGLAGSTETAAPAKVDGSNDAKRARVSKSESVLPLRASAMREELRELREVVEKYEAFIMSKNLKDEFDQFEAQREQDMELKEEQYEQEEEGDDDDDPADKSSAQ